MNTKCYFINVRNIKLRLQQPWYLLCVIYNYVYATNNSINYLCHVSVERRYENSFYMHYTCISVIRAAENLWRWFDIEYINYESLKPRIMMPNISESVVILWISVIRIDVTLVTKYTRVFLTGTVSGICTFLYYGFEGPSFYRHLKNIY